MANWPYNTSQWQKLRSLKLQTEPLCEECRAAGRLKPAGVVDHIVPIKHGGDAFPPLEGLRALCHPCHSRKTARGVEAGAFKSKRARGSCDAEGRPLDAAHPWNGGNGRWSPEVIERRMPSYLKPSAIPLTIVCGPPASGKSTYVRERAGPGDIIICLDRIMQEITGLPEHRTEVSALPRAMERRNARLRGLATDTSHDRAWFIVSAPDPSDRRKWSAMLGGKLVVLNTPLRECIRRIKADETRAGVEDRMIETATNWWRVNMHLAGKSLGAAASGTAANEISQLVSK